ncbi:hypothetical protein [Maribacter sp. ACAM166]|uniref:hypothetical protein n=1 Tax=Maribacter sp. ACAM166 TaxID=2508996 RepID=UPI001BB170C9|nr:hypothetical protein [Maribacter sp. ACAM166]
MEYESEWQSLNDKLRTAVTNQSNDITFNDNGLGYRLEDGKLRGKLNTYPFFNKINKDTFLREVLDFNDFDSGLPVSTLLRNHDFELRIEPGRSLLD